MAKNWAIAIGINQYDHLQPLNYAKRDAQLMQEFLGNEAGFERIFFFSDDSPDVAGKSTRPTRTNLLRVLRQLFENPFMGAGDNFWFFFSGHGIRYADRDYLMPCDGDPEDIENTAIAINFVSERLRRCGADNVVLILDACRNEGKKTGEGIGRQTAQEARQQGVISIFSCIPQEFSYEIEALQQGAFTSALLEGLGIQGQCATVERLEQYLRFRVPELVRQYKNTRQTPYVIAEPVNKSHLILVPRYATLNDIATLKNDAYQAEVNRNLDLAEQLWIRVLAAASGQNMDAVRSLQRIERLRNRPVEQVNWDEAVEFCKKLSQKTKHTYRLPSEAEWEYACRARTTTPFYFGETITTDLVNYNGNYPYGSAPKGEYRQQTIDVGKFPPNSFGLYNMHGDIWEWCLDVYHSNYQDAPKDGSTWLTGKDNNRKLLRGGGWNYVARYCRSANRISLARAGLNYRVGFRVVAVAVA